MRLRFRSMSIPLEAIDGLIALLKTGDKKAAEMASRALRGAARQDASRLKPWGKELLRLAMAAEALPVRWNLIRVVGLLPLTKTQAAVAVDWLFQRLRDKSSLTRTMALQALCDRRGAEPRLVGRLRVVVEEFAGSGTAAMRARARKLMAELEVG